MTLFSRVLLRSSVVLIMSGMLRDVISIGSFGVREMGGHFVPQWLTSRRYNKCSCSKWSTVSVDSIAEIRALRRD